VTENISPKQFRESEGAGDWRVLGDGANAFFRTKSLAESARFVQAISEIAGIEENEPAVDVRHDGVTVRFITWRADYGGMTTRDLEFARKVSAAARNLGLAADPSATQSLLVIPAAIDRTKIMPFWQAALGYEPRLDSPAEDLVDPHDRGAGLWFEQMGEPRKDGLGAIHVVVWVPYEKAKARIAAALAAGGRMVRDENAPSWWTLADPAGNEVDIATTQGRD
jgi:4a-hydroxytetrahydrobiopterin dehydratase